MLIRNLAALDYDEGIRLLPDLDKRKRAYTQSSLICGILRNSVWLSIDPIEAQISTQPNNLCRFILSVAAHRIPRSEAEEIIQKLESPIQSTGRPDFLEKEVAAVWAKAVLRGAHPFSVFIKASAVLGRNFLSQAWADLNAQANERLIPTKITFRGQRAVKDQQEFEALLNDLRSSRGIRRVYRELGLEAFMRSLTVCGESTLKKVFSGFGQVFGTVLGDMVSRASREASDAGINTAVVTSIAKLIELRKSYDIFFESADGKATKEDFIETFSSAVMNLEKPILNRVLREIDGRAFHASLSGMDEAARERIFSVLAPKIGEKLRIELREGGNIATSEILENGAIFARSVLDLKTKGEISIDAGSMKNLRAVLTHPGVLQRPNISFAVGSQNEEDFGNLEELPEDEEN